MDGRHRRSAAMVRASLELGRHDRTQFRAALLAVAPNDRDAWLDQALGLNGLPDDDAELPAGCVPYLPCAVADLLQVVEYASVCEADVFVDVGSGVGRA